MTCLDNIIGLSETTCTCFIDGSEPTDYNKSNSGIYLDQLDGFNIEIAQAADDCSRDGIWARMERAVRNAKFDYKNNLLGCIDTNYKPRINTLNVQLGQSTFQGSINTSYQFAGIKLMPMQIKGGVFIIKKIGIMINMSVPATIKIYSNVPDNNTESTLIYQSAPIPGVQDQLVWATLATPLELPMWAYEKWVKYYVVFDLDGTYQPKKNGKECGCNGTSKPYLQWMDYIGVVGNDINNPDNFSSTTEANGIVLDMTIKCRTADIICSDEYPLDFTDDSYALNMAYAIRFRAAAKLYEELLNTGVINRFTMLNREYVSQKVTDWNNEYMNWINYLCANANFDQNDCLICRTTSSSLVKTTINVVSQNFDWISDYGIRP